MRPEVALITLGVTGNACVLEHELVVVDEVRAVELPARGRIHCPHDPVCGRHLPLHRGGKGAPLAPHAWRVRKGRSSVLVVDVGDSTQQGSQLGGRSGERGFGRIPVDVDVSEHGGHGLGPFLQCLDRAV
eukprot:scaffold8307_cov71-Phaeocystis_antarctica.AAC.7